MPLSFKTDDINSKEHQANVLPEAFRLKDSDNWLVCGEGVFSWSVFRFYRARLLTHTGIFDPAKPFLLDLHYLRTLTGQQIVSTSIDEMARLNAITDDQRNRWSKALAEMMPDVGLGDRLLGWFTPGSHVEFYSATKALGILNDPEFVQMFSAIWLDERARSPQLRQALLGLNTACAGLSDLAVSSGAGA
jgi:hypothetical protein